MNKVTPYISSLPTGATGTTLTFVGKADSIGLYISTMVFASAVIKATLETTPVSGVSARTSYFYDYVNKTPAEAAATISTAGFYEIPNAGGADFARINFDVATTNAVSVYMTTPKVTF